MDILITGGQGSGKTPAAHKLIADYFGVTGVYETKLSQLLIVNSLHGNRVDILRETIRAARVEAVLFDGCILTAGDLITCVTAVKQTRQQTGRDLYVVYVRLTEGLVTTSKYPNNIEKFSDFFIAEAGAPFDEALPVVKRDRTLEILQDLVRDIDKLGDTKFKVRAILDNVNALNVEDLHPDQRPEVHNQLLAALRSYEQPPENIAADKLNLYTFESSSRTIIFELSEINPVSKMHVAVDKMTTSYFRTRHFSKRAFSSTFCRRATPEEYLMYVNAKHEYVKNN